MFGLEAQACYCFAWRTFAMLHDLRLDVDECRRFRDVVTLPLAGFSTASLPPISISMLTLMLGTPCLFSCCFLLEYAATITLVCSRYRPTSKSQLSACSTASAEGASTSETSVVLSRCAAEVRGMNDCGSCTTSSQARRRPSTTAQGPIQAPRTLQRQLLLR